jgi:hypothetical protein
MAVLDEDGYLFGVVNVVDALVVVVVGAVLLGGLVFVGGATPDSSSSAGHATYVTVVVQGNEMVAEQIGNETELTTDSGSLVVTDHDRVVRANGSTATVLRVRRADSGGFFGERPALSVRPGDRMRTTGTFAGLGLQVVRTGTSNSLATRQVELVAHARTTPAIAMEILGRTRRGQPQRTPVNVTRVDSFPTGSETRRLRLGLTVDALTPEGRTHTIQPGTRLPRTATELGTAVRVTTVGQTTPPGARVDRRVVVELSKLSPAVAGTLTRGDRTVATNYPARVTNVTERPATLLVTDAEGRVHERPHPRLQSVTLTLSVPARQYGGVLWYQDERLRVGRPVTLDTGRAVVTGNVASISEPGDQPNTSRKESADLRAPGAATSRQEPGEI